jgi:hypothetical protein
MYKREQKRIERNADIARRLRASADRARVLCTEASTALWNLHDVLHFEQLIHGHQGLLSPLPASLARLGNCDRADAVLHLVVARATLRLRLVRVEVLGWLAQTHPEVLVTLLAVASGEQESSDASEYSATPK